MNEWHINQPIYFLSYIIYLSCLLRCSSYHDEEINSRLMLKSLPTAVTNSRHPTSISEQEFDIDTNSCPITYTHTHMQRKHKSCNRSLTNSQTTKYMGENRTLYTKLAVCGRYVYLIPLGIKASFWMWIFPCHIREDCWVNEPSKWLQEQYKPLRHQLFDYFRM